MLVFIILAIAWSGLTSAKTVDDVDFKLYNRDHDGVPLKGNSTEEDFIKGLPCKFVTHGWTGDEKTESVQEIKNSYLNCSDVNVITVDWSNQAQTINYLSAAWDTKDVGDAVGKEMVELVKAGVCSLNSTHCIGHSLGAHVCADAAKYVQETLGKNISRVTGLDPAGPVFEYNPFATSKLGPSDADYVDAIHTDSVFGYYKRLAQADFYVNGGVSPQPGCLNILRPLCSHRRAYHIFAESICNPQAFLSTSCVSHIAYKAGRCDGQPTVHMGEKSSHSAAGSYFVDTNDSSPYSLS